LAGCGASSLLAALGPETPPTREVLDALPLPADAVIDAAGCVGAPRHAGYLCTVQAHAGVPLEDNGAADRARGWEEVTWDRVPGRIQYSWRREHQVMSAAIFPLQSGTKWSMSYAWGDWPDPPTLDPLDGVACDGAPTPPLLAALPVPERAVLCRATDDGPRALGVWRVPGVSALGALDRPPGPELLRARGYGRQTVAWRDGDAELNATAWTSRGGHFTLQVHRHPAP
ncbi:MAG TPA: hypothetical protein PKA64_16690, partial [Myxococcota bacterium]|nr:hypothetical protein [Myxococcota bacterium]